MSDNNNRDYCEVDTEKLQEEENTSTVIDAESDDDKDYEEICYICRRPEHVAGTIGES